MQDRLTAYVLSCVPCLSLFCPDEAGRACSRPRQWKHGHERARLTPKTQKVSVRLQKIPPAIWKRYPVSNCSLLQGYRAARSGHRRSLQIEFIAKKNRGREGWLAPARLQIGQSRRRARARHPSFPLICIVVCSHFNSGACRFLQNQFDRQRHPSDSISLTLPGEKS